MDDWRSFESPTAAVVEAVADATDRKALELPPLHRSIDTDALNTIVTESDHKNSLEVSFSYCGLAVVLDSNGTLELSELD